MLNNVQLNFLKILKIFINTEFDTKNKIDETQISLKTEKEMKELYELANRHHVVPMIYDIVSRTDAYKACDLKIQKLWRMKSVSMMISQAKHTKLFLDVYTKLIDSGIEALVVKGIVCRELYSKPDLRVSNDEDILIRKSDFEKCDCFLLENGFSREETDIENLGYEVAYCDSLSGLRIEVHTSLFPTDNTILNKLNSEFKNAFNRKKTINVDGVDIHTLDDTYNLYYLICHCFKHFVVSGFGIRQLCDILMIANCCRRNIDWKFIANKTKKYNMFIFLMNLFDIGKTYLGFWNKSNFTKSSNIKIDSENLLMDLLDAGVYGKSNIGRVHSANITLGAIENKKGKSNSKMSLKSSIFPSKKYMRKEYKYLKKHGWLLPVAWSQRIFRYMKKRNMHKKRGDNNVDSITIGKQRIELLKQYGIVK